MAKVDDLRGLLELARECGLTKTSLAKSLGMTVESLQYHTLRNTEYIAEDVRRIMLSRARELIRAGSEQENSLPRVPNSAK